MKKIFIHIFGLFFIFRLSGQTYNYAQHIASESTSNLIGINEKCYYLENSSVGCCFRSVNLVGVAPNFGLLFRINVGGDPVLEYFKLMKTAEQNLLCCTGTKAKGCDYGGYRYNITKVDTLGNIIWNLAILKYVRDIFTAPNGTFNLLIADTFYRYSATGNFLAKIAPGVSGIKEAKFLANGNIAFSYTGTTTSRFRITDPLLNTISDFSTQAIMSDFIVSPNGETIGLTSMGLLKYSPSFTLSYSSANTFPSNINIKAFDYRKDSIFVVAQTTQSQFVYLLLDSAFTINYQSSSNVENATPTGIYIFGNNVNIITTGVSGIYPSNAFPGFFMTSLNGSLNSSEDIGITGLSFFESNFSGSNPFLIGTTKASVTVKNYGTDTVRSFHLNYSMGQSYLLFCLWNYNELYNIKIAPGATISVTTGTFNAGRFNNSAVSADGNISTTLCLHTSVPNEKNDIDVANDFACANIKLIPVGINENILPLNSIQIYPNPSSAGVFVKSFIKINSIEIFDLTGKMLKYSEVNQNEFYLENKILSNGLYIFKINTDKGMVTRKVVIE